MHITLLQISKTLVRKHSEEHTRATLFLKDITYYSKLIFQIINIIHYGKVMDKFQALQRE